MAIDYLAEARHIHSRAVEPSRGRPVGASEDDVAQLEADLGFDVPLAYRQYLLWMGKDHDGIFRGTDCFYGDDFGNTEGLPELLEENGVDFPLPPRYLAFFMHQGYIALWFVLPRESDDPPVWIYHEAEMKRPRVFGKFTDWLASYLKSNAGLPDGDPQSG